MNTVGPNNFRALGRTGLKVSPFALGAMTFVWGAEKETARLLFGTYRNAGGNIVDTADMYSGGTSEECLGEMIQAGKMRDEVVLATKFSFCAQQGNPQYRRQWRKNILRTPGVRCGACGPTTSICTSCIHGIV